MTSTPDDRNILLNALLAAKSDPMACHSIDVWEQIEMATRPIDHTPHIDAALARQRAILGAEIERLTTIRDAIPAPDTGATWRDVAVAQCAVDGILRGQD